jgi:hypothetical protein
LVLKPEISALAQWQEKDEYCFHVRVMASTQGLLQFSLRSYFAPDNKFIPPFYFISQIHRNVFRSGS